MLLYPNEYLDSVKDISLELLNKNNIKGLVLDVDNTLINLDRKMPVGVSDWAKELKSKGIKICILSNSNKIEKVTAVAKIIDVPYIFFGKKPLKSGFKRAQALLKLESENIAVVGDQIFTDVLGANRCDMFSILVKPIEEKDYFDGQTIHTKEFYNILEKNMLPVYESARRQGYEVWEC